MGHEERRPRVRRELAWSRMSSKNRATLRSDSSAAIESRRRPARRAARTRAGRRRGPRPSAVRGPGSSSGAGPPRAARGRGGSPGRAEEAGLARELLDHLPDAAVAPPRGVDDRGQVLPAEAVDLGRGQRVEVRPRAQVGDRAQGGEQQPDLGPRVQPEVPENRHGIPATLNARTIGSAPALVRTSTAWSRGAAPAAMRRPISAAIQSASSEPVANASARTGVAPASGRSDRNRLTIPARTSSRSGSLWRMSR